MQFMYDIVLRKLHRFVHRRVSYAARTRTHNSNKYAAHTCKHTAAAAVATECCSPCCTHTGSAHSAAAAAYSRFSACLTGVRACICTAWHSTAVAAEGKLSHRRACRHSQKYNIIYTRRGAGWLSVRVGFKGGPANGASSPHVCARQCASVAFASARAQNLTARDTFCELINLCVCVYAGVLEPA